MTTSDFLFLFQIVSIIVIILASIGYSVLTPINVMKAAEGQKEANEGTEILLEGITCTVQIFFLHRALHIIIQHKRKKCTVTAHTDAFETHRTVYTTFSLRMNPRGSKRIGDKRN